MKSNALEIVTICGVFLVQEKGDQECQKQGTENRHNLWRFLVPEKEPNMSEIRFSSKEHEKFFIRC